MREGHGRKGFRGGALALVGLVVSLLSVPSLASAGWTSPEVISGIGPNVSQTRVSGTADGTSWVVWKRDVAGFDLIQGSRISADGVAGPVQTISTVGQQATDPVLAVRGDGSAVVAWLDRSTPADSVRSRSIAVDGTFGPVKTRSGSGPAGQPAREITLALGADGSAGIAWRKFDGNYWVAQATVVAPDGTSTTIHDLSEPSSSARSVDIAAAPPTAGGSSAYRAAWAQGNTDTANVYTRVISPEDSLGENVRLLWPVIPTKDKGPTGPGTGGAPGDVHVVFEEDGTMSVAWIRYRTDYVVVGRDDKFSKNPWRTRENGYSTDLYDPSDPDDIPYENWAIEMVRTFPGVVPDNGDGVQPVLALTPVVAEDPYNVEDLDMSLPHGGEVMLTWVHDLNQGGERVETGRYLKGLFRQWVNGAPAVPSAVDPVIAGNNSSVATVGWTEPGPSPGQTTMRMKRFSNTLIGQPFSPAGEDSVQTRDPGFAVADDGSTLAVFTSIDEQGRGSVRMSRYTNPDIRVDTKSLVFGARDIGVPKTMPLVIRNSGETPVNVTSAVLSGSDATQFDMQGADDCVRKIAYQTTCSIRIVYTPSTTGPHSAKVTITSEVGVDDVELSGSGSSRTRNQLSLNKLRFSAKKGQAIAIRATVENKGGVVSEDTRVCVSVRKRALSLAGARCRSLGELTNGATRTLDYRIRVRARAPKGVDLPVSFVMRSANSVVRKAVAQVRRVGR